MKFATAITLPTNNVRITAEFRDIVHKVEVWNGDSHLGSATNVNKPCLTPDWYIELSPEKLPTSIIQFVALSGEKVLFRPRDSPTQQSGPLDELALPWSDEEINLLTEMLRGKKEFSLAAFPLRTPCAVKAKIRKIRAQLLSKGGEVRELKVSLLEKGYTKNAATTVAARFKKMVPVDDVIRELSHAPEQEIRNEYLNLR